MIKLLIGKKTIHIPSELKELSLNSGMQVTQYITSTGELTKKDKIIIIATLAQIETKPLFLFSEKTINEIYNNIRFLKDLQQEVNFYKVFKLNETYYGIIDFKKLTVNEYMDMVFYMNEAEYGLDNLDKVLAIMIRPLKYKKQTLRDILIKNIRKIIYKNVIPCDVQSYECEEYKEEDIDKRAMLFANKLDMGYSILCYQLLLQELDMIKEEFPTILKANEIDEEDKDQYDPEEITKPRKSFESIWGLYHCIATISSSIFERDAWRTKLIREFFTYLTYYNQKIARENDQIRKQQLKNKSYYGR